MAPHCRRILVYGVTGAGKSSLAKRISDGTGIPWHSVDDLAWEPGWLEVPLEEQRRRFEAICSSDKWILDTAYAKWLEVPLASAELIVGLDYARWLSLARLIGRTMRRMRDKEPVCNGNYESMRSVFSRDSIILWHFKSFAGKRRRMRDWAQSDPRVVLLKKQRETDKWLDTLTHKM